MKGRNGVIAKGKENNKSGDYVIEMVLRRHLLRPG
jgi:hypothetical protein